MRAILNIFAVLGTLTVAHAAFGADYREARIPSGKNPFAAEYGLHPILRSSAVTQAPVSDSNRMISVEQERQLVLGSVAWERTRTRADRYGLGGMAEAMRDHEENRSRSSQVLGLMRSYQVRQMRTALHEADRQGRVSRPLILTGTLAATYFGNPFQHDIGGGAQIRGFANFRDHSGALGIYSGTTGEWGMQYDRENQLRLRSRQGFSDLKLTTQVDYVAHDRSVDCQVTRAMGALWSTTLGARMPVAQDSALVSMQGVWRVDFGVSF